jgi:hypothetical protein
MAHKQVFARVKALVDSGIKDVVEALNRIPDVWTFESCEGNSEEESAIWICYGQSNGYKPMAYFADRLYSVLTEAGCRADVSLEWHCGATISPHILLCFRKVQAKSVTNALNDAFSLHSSTDSSKNK